MDIKYLLQRSNFTIRSILGLSSPLMVNIFAILSRMQRKVSELSVADSTTLRVNGLHLKTSAVFQSFQVYRSTLHRYLQLNFSWR